MPINTRMDMLLKEANAQAAQLRRIQNSRHVAPRRLAKARLVANAPTGVDGEIASDQNNCLWLYINGVWQEFVCGGGPLVPTVQKDLLIIGMDNSVQDYFGVNALNIETMTFTQLAAPPDEHEWWMAWWSHDGSKIYAVREVGIPERAKVYSMNPDGSDLTEIGYDENFNAENYVPYTGSPAKFALSDNVFSVKVLNEDGSVETIWTTAEHAVDGFDAPRGTNWSPDGTKLLINTRKFGPTENRHYVFHLASETMTLALDETARWSGIVPRWNPLNNGELMYMGYDSTFFNDEIYLVNEDGTDNRVIYAPGDAYSSAANPVWSPDGTKLAAYFYNTEFYPGIEFHVVNREGDLLYQSPNLIEEDFRVDERHIAWSPNSDALALALNVAPGIDIWDLETMTATTPDLPGLNDIQVISWGEPEDNEDW